jgi:hypothetical protein
MKRDSEGRRRLGWLIAAAAVFIWLVTVFFLSDGFSNFGHGEWLRLLGCSVYVLFLVRLAFLWGVD